MARRSAVWYKAMMMRSGRQFEAVVAAALCWALTACATVAADTPVIEDISGTNYYPAVKAALDTARSSVDVAMYEIRVYRDQKESPPYKLVAALVAAHERGVAVRVLLDGAPRYSELDSYAVEHDRNALAAELLTDAGIAVRLTTTRRLHAKLIVIDAETVIEGSVNWSFSALTRNVESASLIRSAACAQTKLALIDAIRSAPPGGAATAMEQEPAVDTAAGLPIPEWFLFDGKLAPLMVSKHDDRAFELYLVLRAECGRRTAEDGRQTALSFDRAAGVRMAESLNMEREAAAGEEGSALVVDYGEYAKALGLDHMSRAAYRRQITKTLKKLRSRYGLIEYELNYDDAAVVRLKERPEAPGAMKVCLAGGYWDYGWSRKLSTKAALMYMVGLRRQAMSHETPWWTATLDQLAEECHISRWTVTTALAELEDADLAEIEHSRVPMGEHGLEFAARRPNRYMLKRFRADAEAERGWNLLEEEYGTTRLATARKLATAIGTPNSQGVVRKIAEALREYGDGQVDRALAIMAELRSDNPRRNVDYLIGILKAEAGTGRDGESNIRLRREATARRVEVGMGERGAGDTPATTTRA